jgi:beta-lactamase superfamily II metal-dependent hydrolase
MWAQTHRMSSILPTGKTPERTLAILDVGHGNCAVLRDEKGVVVVDAGPGSGLLQYLADHKIDHVEVLFLSHADKDHIGGAAQLLASKTVTVGRVCLNTDSAKGSAVWDDLVYELNRADNAGKLKFDVSLVHDTSGQYDQGKVRIEVLAPSKYLAAKGAGSTDRQGRKLSNNSVSAVIRFVHNGQPIATLPGDIDEIGLDDLVDNRVDIRAVTLVYPHHGGKGGRDEPGFVTKVCDLVKPATVIFSVARDRLKHPLPDVIALVRKQVKDVRIACTQLNQHCATKAPTAKPNHLAAVYAQGRDARHCCAGTVLLQLDDTAVILPDRKAHEAFITAEAPSALCRLPTKP